MAARYPLQPLLQVRQFRERAAEQGVRVAEAALVAAEKKKKEQEQALVTYRAWRAEEEDRRYADIMNRCLSLDELDTFKASLAALALAELDRQEAITQAEAARQKAMTVVTEARELFAKARKDTGKIAAHKDIWLEEEKKETARLEDVELEDFRALSPFKAE